MWWARLIAATAALIGLGPLSQCARITNQGFPVDWDTSHAGERLDLSDYRLVFADEFDQLRVSREGGPGPWYAPIHTALGMGDLAVPPDPAFAVANGELRLSTRKVAGRWREANIQTQDSTGRGFGQRDGYFEARIALPREAGAHAGFWLLSHHDRDRGHAEFDIVESYGEDGRWGHHATSHIWPGEQSGHGHIYTSAVTPTASLLSGFHTFGALADPYKFVVYYDRREVARIARRPEQQAPLYLLISLFENGGDPVQEPAVMRVDWVRAYAKRPPAQP